MAMNEITCPVRFVRTQAANPPNAAIAAPASPATMPSTHACGMFVTTTPTTQSVMPVSMAAHAPRVVPQRVYRPPMMAAPPPATKMLALMAANMAM